MGFVRKYDASNRNRKHKTLRAALEIHFIQSLHQGYSWFICPSAHRGYRTEWWLPSAAASRIEVKFSHKMRDSLKYQMIHLLSYLFLAKYSQIKQRRNVLAWITIIRRRYVFSVQMHSNTFGVYIGYMSNLHLENSSLPPGIFLCGVCMYIKLFFGETVTWRNDKLTVNC